jgi:hypothetical protein
MLLFKPTKEEIEKATRYNSVVELKNQEVLSHFLIEHQSNENRFMIKYIYTPNWVELHKEANVTWVSDKKGKCAVIKTYAQLHTGEIASIELTHRV